MELTVDREEDIIFTVVVVYTGTTGGEIVPVAAAVVVTISTRRGLDSNGNNAYFCFMCMHWLKKIQFDYYYYIT